MTSPRPQLNLSEFSGPQRPTEEPSEVGWMAALTAMGGALDRGLWPELPAAFARLAPVRQVLEGAGDRAALPAQDGGEHWQLFGFPDLRRSTSKVLALREGPDPEAPELRLLHRHPRPSGLCAAGGWLPARGVDAGPLSEARYGRPLLRPAGLYADDVDALYLLRGREVLRWDGRKESSLGPPSSALASLMLAWSQR